MKKVKTAAYCGVDCSECKMYLATINDELDRLSFETSLPINHMQCRGCRSDENSIFSNKCAIKKCCRVSNQTSCDDCSTRICSVKTRNENN